MELTIKIFTGIIIAIHLYIVWLETLAWKTRGKKVFKRPPEFFEHTKTLAANQGVYNGFLAVGLIWSLLISNEIWRTNISLFFLSCIAIAGLFGGATADKKIFFVQALPALITIWLIALR